MANSLREQLQTSLGTAYTLERELSGGGMAHVFLARDETLGRAVVVKVLPVERFTGLSAERFAREIRLAARLQEPHIVPVLSAGTTGEGLPYYTMPFVRGDSLRVRLAGGLLPINEAVSILRDVARALAYAHEQGIVHRDIKPENVLLAGDTAVVTDFGIAKAVGVARTRDSTETGPGTLTEAGTSVGTPAYMSPEQGAGDAVDARADLYAWGVIAYELLAGKHPFAGKITAQQLIAAHISESPAPLAGTRTDVPSALAALVMRCLEKDPMGRPQSAELLLATLRDVDTRPPPMRRRPVAAAAVGAVVIAVGAAFLVRARISDSPRPLPTARVDSAAGTYSTPHVSSLAVLPLANYSRDPAQDYFADGMTEELTSTLSKLQALRVIAHRSMLQFKGSAQSVPDVARLMGVKYVMEASVQQEGDHVRIRATLIDATTNAPVWTESFDRERRDVLALQREVALAIAREIEITLTPQDRLRLAGTPRVDPIAFDLYIKGTQARHKAFARAEANEAIVLFERAIARDPNFAPAHTGLALLKAATGDGAGARRSAERARALDSTLAEAPMVLGMLQMFDFDWVGAEASFRQAIWLNPGLAEAHHELSMYLLRRERFEEAIREAKLAIDLAPLTPRFESGLGEVLVFSGQYDDAIVAARKALSLDSTYGPPGMVLAIAYTEQGKFEMAEQAMERCSARGCAEHARSVRGYIYAITGNRVKAVRILDTLKAQWSAKSVGPGVAVRIAMIHAGLGERARALDWLERGAQGGAFMLYLGVDPFLRSLRPEPRFRALLRRLKLPESR